MAAHQVTRRSLAETLRAAAESIDGETISLGELLEIIGEQGLLMICIVLMIPFLLPVSVPGVSTLFSVVVMFAGVAVATDRRTAWLPERIVRRRIGTRRLVTAFERGSRLARRLDRMAKPRMLGLTDGPLMTRVNGGVLWLGGVFLIFPLGGVPLSNTLPALAVVLVAAGITQRDGLFVLGGYLMLLVSAAYFALLGYLVFVAGRSLTNLFALCA